MPAFHGCVFTLVTLASVLLSQRTFSQPVYAVPARGDQFVIHHEQVSSGTYTLNGGPSTSFKQALTADLSALVVRSVTQVHGWEASYQYDYLRIEAQVEGASPTVLEVRPALMVLDGSVTYNARLHPDAPPPLVNLMVLEEFKATIGNSGELMRFEECEKYRELLPFLDLTQPIHETWMHRPPPPLSVGVKWAEDRPFRLWAGRFMIPASQTYEIKALPSAPDVPALLTFARVFRMNKPRRIPFPLGDQVPVVLRFDALGPDINSGLPELRITSLVVSSKGTIQYRLDRGFLAGKQSNDWIDIEMQVPNPDGIEMNHKSIRMDRTMRTAVTYSPAGQLSQEARIILFGK